MKVDRKVLMMKTKEMRCPVHGVEMVLVREFLHVKMHSGECQYHWECPVCERKTERHRFNALERWRDAS